MNKNFTVTDTELEGLYKVQFKVIEDSRGSVMEFYRASDFSKTNLPLLGDRPQINAPLSFKGSTRGIHAESAHKLVSVISGKIFAVIVDLRRESATFRHWVKFELERGEGLFISNGLGNSFQSVSNEPSVYLYYFEKEWTPDMPGLSCNPLDPELAIPWPISEGNGMIISDKDRNNLNINELFSNG